MNDAAKLPTAKTSVAVFMAERYGMEPHTFLQTIRATVLPKECTREQEAAFLLVAKEYNLNPILKEIYAFPTKGGGIQPIVGIDGWMRIINDHPAFDGMSFEDHIDGGKLTAITCKIHRKDRAHPISVTEYMDECRRDTEPWRKWSARMLRHKSAIQCARYAFGFSGIVDPDEYERASYAVVKDATVTPPAPPVVKDYQQRIANGDYTPGVAPSYVIEGLKEEQAKRDDLKQNLRDSIEIEKAKEEAAAEDRDAIDIDKYLDELGVRMAGTKSIDYLDEIWAEHMEAAKAYNMFPPDRQAAEDLYFKNKKRLEGK